MIKRLWTVASTSFSIWMMARTLRDMKSQSNTMFTEFWDTLTKEQQEDWIKLFGKPPIIKLETVELKTPSLIPPTVSQIEGLKFNI